MENTYSKKAVAGFICMILVMAAMILFAITDIQITNKELRIYFFVIVSLTSITSFILSLLGTAECRDDENLKGGFLSMITMLLFVLFVILMVIAMTTHSAPAPKPTCEAQGGQCKTTCSIDQREITGTCKNDMICCGVPRN